MELKNAILAEFDVEVANTRKVLERIPMDNLAWKPHDKSTAIGRLATHIATLPAMVVNVYAGDEFDIGAADPARFSYVIDDQAKLLATFDENASNARALLAGATPEQLDGAWTFRWGEKVIFSQPRHMVHRMFTMNHMIHHRAQLTVYLRLLDIPVPSLYGPTADEPM
jgi:uncharacterized damage-inducible protein DinB